MLDKFKWLGHSSIKYSGNFIIYIDPYNIKDDLHDADYIFITHSYYDHFSPNDIMKCMNKETIIIVTDDLVYLCLEYGFLKDSIISVLPNNNYKIHSLEFSTISAYNINSSYHPKQNNWVGYVITLDSYKYYIAGDTDVTDENKMVKCDVAFLPVGGTYTMDYIEAARLANIILPKVVVPIHYGTIIGDYDDAVNFKKLLYDSVECNFLN